MNSLPRQHKPGFLFAPFGWAAGGVIKLLEQDRALLTDIAHLSRDRMHLIVLALDVTEGLPQAPARLLFRGSTKEVIDAIATPRPTGLKRAIRQLPKQVLAPTRYRQLLELLQTPQTAKLLHHSNNIDGELISLLADTPKALRPVVFFMQQSLYEMQSFTEGLRWLVRQGVASTLDDLVSRLANAREPDQMIRMVATIIEGLPVPDGLPPRYVGQLRRLDTPTIVRRLAKQWKNCLVDYVSDIEDARVAVYLWDGLGLQAACLVRRHGRFGWFLDEIKGPDNCEIAPSHLPAIHKDFESAGVLRASAIAALEQILMAARMQYGERRCRVAARQRRPHADDLQ